MAWFVRFGEWITVQFPASAVFVAAIALLLPKPHANNIALVTHRIAAAVSRALKG
jgi:hypothetical protein